MVFSKAAGRRRNEHSRLKGKLAFFIKTESFTSYDPEIAMFPRKTLSCVGQELCPGMLRAPSGFVRTQMFRRKKEPE